MTNLWLPTGEVEIIYRIPTPMLHADMCEDEVAYYIGLSETMLDPNQARDVLNDNLPSNEVDQAIEDCENATTIIIRANNDENEDESEDVTEVNTLY
jgi:hypothetical protein